MKTLLLENGDFVLKHRSFVWVEGEEELAQSVKVELQTALGEFFLEPESGMDRTSIIGKNFNANEAKSSIIEALANEPRVSLVEEINFVRVERVLSIELKLVKQDGTTLQIVEVI